LSEERARKPARYRWAGRDRPAEPVSSAPGRSGEPVQLTVAGEDLRPSVLGGLWWEAERTLIVSDLHLEKGSSYARRGIYLPPYDSRETLARLERLVARTEPTRIIALGDSFHDRHGADRLSADDRASLIALAKGREWVWILGNHDPEPPKDLPGEAMEALALGALVFRHEPSEMPAPGEIAGHLHPVASIRGRGRRVRRRCFMSDGTRVIMPAFGAYTGGLCALDPAYAPYFGRFHAWMMGERRVYPVAAKSLVPDVRW